MFPARLKRNWGEGRGSSEQGVSSTAYLLGSSVALSLKAKGNSGQPNSRSLGLP